MSVFTRNARLPDMIPRLIIASLIIVINFQVPDLSFTTGIDSPLKWVFNHLFETGLSTGRDIIFPHGPLAFFAFPLPKNLLFVLIVTGILQLAVILGIFELWRINRKNEWLFPILISSLLINLMGFFMLVLASLSLAYLNYHHAKKDFYKYLGFLLTAFAFYIKAYAAIISLSITISFILLEWISHRKWSVAFKDGMILFLALYLLWFLMYGSLSGFFRYVYGLFNLGADNSAALAFYPGNNWLLVSVFICTTLILPFVQKTREGTHFGLLFLLSLFLAWKHGMAREDIPHIRIFFIYVFMLMSFFLIFNRKNMLINILFIGIGLSAFHWNISMLPYYTPRKIEFSGIHNFIEFVSGYKSALEKASSGTEKNLAPNMLPDHVRKDVGESTADVYPWDYSIIPVNDLKWTPRPVIQSFVSYTKWLEKQNVKHFESESAPDFIIWDLDKITVDYNGGAWESIDQRYLLNDEPNALPVMMCRYEPLYRDESFLVLKKRDIPLQYDSEVEDDGALDWDRWIGVPENSGDLLRVKAHIKRNLPGKLKSILYKDESSYVYCRLSNGEIVKYRIVPKNCEDGLWLDPFIFEKGSFQTVYRIDSILFKSTDKKFQKNRIGIEWQTLKFRNHSGSPILDFFGMDTLFPQDILLKKTLLSSGEMDHWSNLDPEGFKLESASGRNTYPIKPGSYSPGFELLLDALKPVPVRIRAGMWLKSERTDLTFVISIETPEHGLIKWQGVNIREQIIDERGWNHVIHYLDWDLASLPGDALLKAYLINNGRDVIYMDDFSVSLSMRPEPPPVYGAGNPRTF